MQTDALPTVSSTALFAFIGELEELKQKAEQRGHDLMLSQAHRDANNAGASAYAFCQVRLKAIISQANVKAHTQKERVRRSENTENK